MIIIVVLLSPSIAYLIYLKTKIGKMISWKKSLHKFSFAVAALINFGGIIYLFNSASESQAVNRSIKDLENRENELKYQNETALVARKLLSFLRESGVNEELVADVRPLPYRKISVVVTNAWLRYPSFEQKQMRQTIGLALKSIFPPDGYPFEIIDLLGNRI